jgi:hypothetical protein
MLARFILLPETIADLPKVISRILMGQMFLEALVLPEALASLTFSVVFMILQAPSARLFLIVLREPAVQQARGQETSGITRFILVVEPGQPCISPAEYLA